MSSLAIRSLAPAIHFLVSEILLFLQAARDAMIHCTRCTFSVQWLLQIFYKTVLLNKACSVKNDSITVVDQIMLRRLLLSVMKRRLINTEIWLTQFYFLLNCTDWVRAHHWWIANQSKIFIPFSIAINVIELLLLYQCIRVVIPWPSVQGVAGGVNHMSGTSWSHRTKTK